MASLDTSVPHDNLSAHGRCMMFHSFLFFISSLVSVLTLNSAFAAIDPDVELQGPEGYAFHCFEGDECYAGPSSNVAYGADGQFVYRRICGVFTCGAEMLGMAADDSAKRGCFIPVGDLIALEESTGGHYPGSRSLDKSNGDNTAGDGSESAPDPGCVAGAVIKNKTIDCKGKRIGLKCKNDSEHQPPVIELQNATVKNLVISKDGGSDGVHCTQGNCTLINVIWEDVCEDAATNLSEGGTMTIIGGSAYNDTQGPGGKPDKIFQHNSKNSTTVITGGFQVLGEHGKLWRSCGNCTNNGGPRHVVIDDVIIDGKVNEGLVGVIVNFGDTAVIKNVIMKKDPTSPGTICNEWKGSSGKGEESKMIGEARDTPNCQVLTATISTY